MIYTRKCIWGGCLFLVLATFALYWRTASFNFTRYDDCDYVIQSAVTNGLTVANVGYAFTREASLKVSNYHPLTLLSLMFDVTLAGGWKTPAGVEDPHVASVMHIHNAVLHALNAGLVYGLMFVLVIGVQKKDKAISECCSTYTAIFVAAVAAAFWAWHPLRVESVAWISQRKDVLSLFFLLIGVGAYLYARVRSCEWSSIIVCLCYLLAFLAKPTAIVYPLLLMLLDYVFAQRIYWRRHEAMLLLMLIFIAITLFIQSEVGATVAMRIPLLVRLENAVAAIGTYIRTTLVPLGLSPMNLYKYPIPAERFWWGFGCIFIFLFFLFHWGVPHIVANFEKQAKGLPEKGYTIEPLLLGLAGLFWFGISLGPVIGLVHVGYASHADRYTYLSGIGLSMIIIVLLQQVLFLRKVRGGVVILCSLVLVVFSVLTYRQMACWRNQFVFFEHVLRLDKANFVAASSHCVSLTKEGRTKEALCCIVDGLKHFYDTTEHRGIVTDAGDQMVIHLIVVFAAHEGQPIELVPDGAKIQCDIIPETVVLDSDPDAICKLYAQALYAYHKKLNLLAEQRFRAVLRLSPLDSTAWRFLGYTLERNEDYTGAIAAYEKSLAIEANSFLKKHVQKLKEVHS